MAAGSEGNKEDEPDPVLLADPEKALSDKQIGDVCWETTGIGGPAGGASGRASVLGASGTHLRLNIRNPHGQSESAMDFINIKNI